MIFDCDTHFSPYRKLPESANAEEWNAFMEEAGVDKAICYIMQQHLDEIGSSNKYVYESSKKYPRMVPFGWVSLKEGLPAMLDEIKRCFEEYGFWGIKINGSQNMHNIDSEESLKMIELIAKYGKKLAFHIGADSPEYTDPMRGRHVCQLFPNTDVFMIHMGGATEPDVSERVIEAAKDCPRMVLVGSSISMKSVANGIRTLGPEKILFGSDTPYHGPTKHHVENYREMLKEFDAKTTELVMGGNAQRIFFGN